MFSQMKTGKSRRVVHAINKLCVIATETPLTERFSNIPSHNPLRPNYGSKRTVGLRDVAGDNEINLPFVPRRPFPFRNQPYYEPRVNKSAVMKAKEDAKIRRLRAQLHATQFRLNMSNRNARGKDFLRRIERVPRISWKNAVIPKRFGGGHSRKPWGTGTRFSVQSHGSTLRFMGSRSGFTKGGKFGISPLKGGAAKKGASGLNFFGEPKSKEDLDKELDAYMSKSKTKQKSDLDKELDAYMSVARSQSFAGKAGSSVNASSDTAPKIDLSSTAATSINADSIDLDDDLDVEMELAD